MVEGPWRQHDRNMSERGIEGGLRKRLKSSQFMGGESRGRVVADEGVQESRSTRELVPLLKAGSNNTYYI